MSEHEDVNMELLPGITPLNLKGIECLVKLENRFEVGASTTGTPIKSIREEQLEQRIVELEKELLKTQVLLEGWKKNAEDYKREAEAWRIRK